jgi:hypothetical protein
MIMSVRTTDPNTKIVSESYVGSVLAEFEENGYHDSYGSVAVWDADKGMVRHVSTWSTAYYSSTAADVDATEETILNAREWAHKIIFRRMIDDHPQVAAGKNVKSLTTRGKAKGVSGEVVRLERDQYARAYGDYIPQVAVIKVTAPYDNPHYGRNLYVQPDRLEVTDELTPEVIAAYSRAAAKITRNASMADLFHPRWGKCFRV